MLWLKPRSATPTGVYVFSLRGARVTRDAIAEPEPRAREASNVNCSRHPAAGHIDGSIVSPTMDFFISAEHRSRQCRARSSMSRPRSPEWRQERQVGNKAENEVCLHKFMLTEYSVRVTVTGSEDRRDGCIPTVVSFTCSMHSFLLLAKLAGVKRRGRSKSVSTFGKSSAARAHFSCASAGADG